MKSCVMECVLLFSVDWLEHWSHSKDPDRQVHNIVWANVPEHGMHQSSWFNWPSSLAPGCDTPVSAASWPCTVVFYKNSYVCIESGLIVSTDRLISQSHNSQFTYNCRVLFNSVREVHTSQGLGHGQTCGRDGAMFKLLDI